MFSISSKKIQKDIEENDKPLTYIEVSSDDPISFTYILIKNFYVASISIMVFYEEKWHCILENFRLMVDPDSEEDSERYFIIHRKNTKLEEKQLDDKEYKIMRFYLIQNSLMWKDFDLHLIKLLRDTEDDSEKVLDKVIYQLSSKPKFEFKDRELYLLHDKEEINQKYFEMTNSANADDIKLDIFY